VRKIFSKILSRSGTYDCRRRRQAEVPVGVQDRFGTKAAQSEDEDDVLEIFHLNATMFAGPKSR
jgi:hypothetical protein